ncbi:glycosyl transferase family 2 [Tenacibaculum maritimum]|uniref:glycosyl transferase family 2 n=1 Tax=Tenacibaculum maritimum TaxID=107401 RepID=UPI00389086F4
MRSIKELQERLHPKNSFEHRYNTEADDKIHLLYVSPRLNATGYYRMIAPALEINKTTTHKAIVTSIESYDFSSRLSDFVNQLDERLLAWADYVIFPPLFSDVSYLVKAIKILNPTIQLVMDVDKNYFAIPDTIPLSRKLTQEKLQFFQSNLGLMDLVTVANKPFQNFLQRLIDDRLETAHTLVHHIPSLVSRFGYEEMPPIQKSETGKLHIGIIKPTEEDLLSLKEVLFLLRKTFDDKIKIIYFGNPYTSKEVVKLLKEIDCEVHSTVSFLDYFEKLNSLQLDIVLLPARESLLNRHQNHQLFLELSVFGIPIVASIHNTATLLIEERETSFMASEIPEWVDLIKSFIDDDSVLKRVAKNTLKSVWRKHSYNSKTLESLTEIFI